MMYPLNEIKRTINMSKQNKFGFLNIDFSLFFFSYNIKHFLKIKAKNIYFFHILFIKKKILLKNWTL